VLASKAKERCPQTIGQERLGTAKWLTSTAVTVV